MLSDLRPIAWRSCDGVLGQRTAIEIHPGLFEDRHTRRRWSSSPAAAALKPSNNQSSRKSQAASPDASYGLGRGNYSRIRNRL